MFLKKNFYITNTNNGFILVNTETKTSYQISPEHLAKLAAPNAGNEKDFADIGIVCPQPEQTNWPYAPISKLFFNSIYIRESDLEAKDEFQFWQEYLGVCESVEDEEEPAKQNNFGKIELPPAREIDAPFYELLKKRRTIREFNGQTIALQEMADILFTAFGKFHDSFEEEYLDFDGNISWRRSSPSAGGLHCVDAYVFVSRVDGLEKGTYFYDSKQHCLYLIKQYDYENDLADAFLSQHFHKGCAFGILCVGNLETVVKKYPHTRAVLTPHLDNGHLVQTAWLAAISLGLKGWISAALCDEFFAKELHLKPTQIALTMLCLGHGVDESLGPKNRETIKKINDSRLQVGAMVYATAKEKVVLKK